MYTVLLSVSIILLIFLIALSGAILNEARSLYKGKESFIDNDSSLSLSRSKEFIICGLIALLCVMYSLVSVNQIGCYLGSQEKTMILHFEEKWGGHA